MTLQPFNDRLERCADIYRIHKYNFEEAASQAEVRAALDYLYGHSSALLEGLPPCYLRSRP